MGQSTSLDTRDVSRQPFSSEYDFLHEQIRKHSSTLRQLTLLTYEDLCAKIKELNNLSSNYMDCNGKQLQFEIKPGTDSSVLWKGTVRIKCMKINPSANGRVEKVRELSLKQFLQVYNTMEMQLKGTPPNADNNADDGKLFEQTPFPTSSSDISSSTMQLNFDMDTSLILDQAALLPGSEECCICMERKPEVSLPCTHSYCLACIEQWNVNNKTCPICRDKLENTDDTWVLEELPKPEDVSNELQKSLFDVAG